jgi:multidrug efflux pump subunit AcrB
MQCRLITISTKELITVNKIIAYLAEKRLLVLLLTILMVIVGIGSLTQLNRESYPNVNFDMVTVQTIYPGGSPDEIEQLIAIPIEKKIREVDGIDKVRSYNIENASVLAIYLQEGLSNKDEVVQEIKDAVDSVEDLPSDAESPLVSEIKADKTQVVYYAVQGASNDTPYYKLRETGKKFEDFLYSFKGVAEINKEGYLDKEFLVEVDPSKLTLHHMAIDSVINTLKYRNYDIPGGPLRLGKDELILRTKGQYESAKEIKNTVINANDEGYGTKVSDVAKVSETYEEPDIYRRIDGKPCIIYQVFKQHSMDEIALADKIKADVANFKGPFPDDVNIVLYHDQSTFTRNNINTVVSNAALGFILLAAILFIFLGPRMASIVTLTIPLVFTVAFIGLNSAGITLNVISLFGMIMVLGMIVDFGIVVSENTHRYMEMGFTKRQAIAQGIGELVLPVTVTFICISAAFAPLLILTGMMGKFIKYIPMVIIICLTASWFVALFFMPAILNTFLGHSHKKSKKEEEPAPAVTAKKSTKKTTKKSTAKAAKKEAAAPVFTDGETLETGVSGRLQRGYMGILHATLKFRYITVAVLFVLLVGSVMMIKVVGFVFMQGGGSEQITINTTLPVSRNLEYNLSVTRKMENIIMNSIPESELKHVYSSVGEEETGVLDPRPGDGTNKTTISVFLVPEKDRDRIADDIDVDLRAKFEEAIKNGEIPKELTIKTTVESFGPPIGKPINIEIRGDDFATIRKIADEYEAYLGGVDGVYDVADDLEKGKEELRYKINDQMSARTGVSVASIGNVLNAAYSGSVATNVKIEDEDIDVRVRFQDELRNKRSSVDDVMISNSRGGLIPLSSVTYLKRQPGYSSINRLNYKRLVQVQAKVDTEVTTPMEVNQKLAEDFADLSTRYPGYEVAYGGEQEDTNESMGQLGRLFLIALLVIYIVLAVFFNSTLVPVVIMIAIPFALVGIVFALLTFHEPMSFMSALALFSLAGIIVSNTVTLIEFINNKRRDEGLSLKNAIAEAGALRLRPVILTTGTTVLGLVPTVIGIGDKNYMVYPLALAFAFGLIFASVITLVLVPCFYHIAEDWKQLCSRILKLFGINFDGKLYTE